MRKRDAFTRLADRLSVRELIAKHTWWHRKAVTPCAKPVRFEWATPDDDSE